MKCYFCGSTNVEIHHVYFGSANRKISDRYGFIEPLCREHHTGNQGVHFNRDMDLELKRKHQTEWEEAHGRQSFRDLIGRSYE